MLCKIISSLGGIYIIVVIVGSSCSGKTILCEYLTKKGYDQVIHASKIVKKRYDLIKNNLTLSEFTENEYNSKGYDTFGKEFLQHASRLNNKKPIIIEGLRSVEELMIFKDNYQDIFCVGIFADEKTRFERNKNRVGRKKYGDYTDFILKDMREYSFGISKLLSNHCDNVIINDTPLTNFYEIIDLKIINEYLC